MAGQAADVPVYAGDTLTMQFTCFADAEMETPSDLSGWALSASWRKRALAATAIDLDVDASDSANGVVVISATPEQTTAMGGDGVWDLQGVDVDEQVFTFLRGRTVWQSDVTRA